MFTTDFPEYTEEDFNFDMFDLSSYAILQQDDHQTFSPVNANEDDIAGLFDDENVNYTSEKYQSNSFDSNTSPPMESSYVNIFDQLNMIPDSPKSPSSHSTDSKNSSKFDKSSFTEKRGRRENSSEKQSVKKRTKKTASKLQHTKFSESASYMEINTDTEEIDLVIEVGQTKRRQNGPIESDMIEDYCNLSFKINNLNTQKTNYVSLKGLLDKKTIYDSKKVTKFYTWIRVKGTEEYLFLYCQTGKTSDVHNVISIDNRKGISTRSDHLSRYSGKCSNTVQVIGPKRTKY